MEFVQEKINEGRLIAALSLEEQVLRNGVLPSSSLPERASLVKGILTGLLELGKWQEAVTLVYTPGSAARGLFDGDFAGFRSSVLETISHTHDRYLGSETKKVLLEHKETAILYAALTTISMDEESAANLLYEIHDDLSVEQKSKAYTALGTKMLERREYQKARECFQTAGNEKAIEGLYETILNEFPATIRNFDLLTDLAKDNAQRKMVIARKILKVTEGVTESLGSFGAVSVYQELHGWQKSLPFSDKEKTAIKKLLLQNSSNMKPHLQFLKDEGLDLEWARCHVKEHPKTAYKIMRAHQYEGKETIEAVLHGLEKEKDKYENERLEPRDIDAQHLIAVYPKTNFYQKVGIALYLKDKQKLLDLAQQYATGSTDRKDNSRYAYSLWLTGEGDSQDSFAIKMRAKIIDETLEHKFYYQLPFGPEDTFGIRELYDRAIEVRPTIAYDAATKLQDEALVQAARERIVAQSPEDAFDLFMEKKDVAGKNLALQALAQKFNVPLATIEHYQNISVEKNSR